jgi:hypothetical protein
MKQTYCTDLMLQVVGREGAQQSAHAHFGPHRIFIVSECERDCPFATSVRPRIQPSLVSSFIYLFIRSFVDKTYYFG